MEPNLNIIMIVITGIATSAMAVATFLMVRVNNRTKHEAGVNRQLQAKMFVIRKYEKDLEAAEVKAEFCKTNHHSISNIFSELIDVEKVEKYIENIFDVKISKDNDVCYSLKEEVSKCFSPLYNAIVFTGSPITKMDATVNEIKKYIDNYKEKVKYAGQSVIQKELKKETEKMLVSEIINNNHILINDTRSKRPKKNIKQVSNCGHI